MLVRRLLHLLLLLIPICLIVGCGSGDRVINVGDNTVIEPPVGTEATSPSLTKFGPVADYLPPSGTVINYNMAGIFGENTVHRLRFQFVAYDNTAGSMTLDMRIYEGSYEQQHERIVAWVKKVNNLSYCWKRKITEYEGSYGFSETRTLTPGVLMGLFSSSAAVTCTFTEAGAEIPTHSHSYRLRYLGTSTITAGGTTYTNCVGNEASNFLVGDILKAQVYWAPQVGPIMVGFSPVISVASSAHGRLPWWSRLMGVSAQSISSAK